MATRLPQQAGPLIFISPILIAATVATGVLTAGGIALMRPWLARVASANPNWRSSHRKPVPQSAGVAMMASLLVVTAAVLVHQHMLGTTYIFLVVALTLATGLGFADDIRPLPWRTKLAGQILAAICAAAGLPNEASLVPASLFWIERAMAAAALVVIINIVNFIDGIDEISIAHALPAALLALCAGLILNLALPYPLLAAALIGALAGFWPWNRHPARIFLGDAGSLPLGLLLGWLGLWLALAGQIGAALLMLLYPLTDGGITLGRRFLAGRPLTEAHRDHAYQIALDTGMSAPRIAGWVSLVSMSACLLAWNSLLAHDLTITLLSVALGIPLGLTLILHWLARRR